MEHGTSESAAQGVDGAWVARSGFILYGIAVFWVVQLCARQWGWAGTVCHLGFAVGMFGVAAFAHAPWDPDAAYVESEDLLHSVSAGAAGFGFIVGVIAVVIARWPSSIRVLVGDFVAIGVALVVPLMMSTDSWGPVQRTMFAVAAIWYGREARNAQRNRGRNAPKIV